MWSTHLQDDYFKGWGWLEVTIEADAGTIAALVTIALSGACDSSLPWNIINPWLPHVKKMLYNITEHHRHVSVMEDPVSKLEREQVH